MRSSVDRLIETLDQFFAKGEWGLIPTLLSTVKDLTPAQAAWKPVPQRKSIWQNVNHIAFWLEYMTSRMAGEPPRPPGWHVDLDWREIVEVNEEAWRAAIQRLIDAHTAVKAQLVTITDEQLDRPVVGRRRPVSLYGWIQRIIAHNTYHCGQIRYLRALQGLDRQEL